MRPHSWKREKPAQLVTVAAAVPLTPLPLQPLLPNHASRCPLRPPGGLAEQSVAPTPEEPPSRASVDSLPRCQPSSLNSYVVQCHRVGKYQLFHGFKCV